MTRERKKHLGAFVDTGELMTIQTALEWSLSRARETMNLGMCLPGRDVAGDVRVVRKIESALGVVNAAMQRRTR